MVAITFIDHLNVAMAIDAPVGTSLMEVAVAHDIAGIEAQCYGAGVCGTCHVYVAPDWFGAAGAKSEWEQDMLDGLPLVRPASRLACQIRLDENLDGAMFALPERQDAMG